MVPLFTTGLTVDVHTVRIHIVRIMGGDFGAEFGGRTDKNLEEQLSNDLLLGKNFHFNTNISDDLV